MKRASAENGEVRVIVILMALSPLAAISLVDAALLLPAPFNVAATVCGWLGMTLVGTVVGFKAIRRGGQRRPAG